MSLRARITLTIVGLLAITLFSVGVATQKLVERSLVDRVDERLRSVTFGDLDRSGDRRGGPSDNGLRFALIGTDGRSQRGSGTVSFRVDPKRVRLASEGRAVHFSTSISGRSYRVLLVPRPGGLGLGTVSDGPALAVIFPLSEVNATLSRLLRIELILSALALGLAALFGWILVRRELRPLRSIATTAGAIAEGDLTQRIADSNPRTEVGQLGLALNEMLQQIEGAFTARTASENRLRRFVADASHELRTPLTSIRGYAELFRRGASQRPGDLAKSMARIESEATRMSSLVDDLLLLARLDERPPLALERVDLGALAEEAVAAARVVEPARPIAFDPPGEVFVEADPLRLRQVIDNLLANVRVHTPPETACTVSIEREATDAMLTVRDEGPGLEPELAARVFERFVRADGSRSRDAGGSGLGLSIAHAIVGAHGGSIAVETAVGAGTAFVLRLPLAAE